MPEFASPPPPADGPADGPTDRQPDPARPHVLVLYHGDCPDGFVAAWAAWRHYRRRGQPAEFLPAVHGDRPPVELARGRVVEILDFCYKMEDAEEFAALVRAALSTIVVDHHKTAPEVLAAVARLAAEPDPPARLAWRYDVDQSGAALAWDFYRPAGTEPRLVRYVQDSDLWRWELPISREVSAYLSTLPWDFEAWDRAAAVLDAHPVGDLHPFYEPGAAVRRFQERVVAEHVDRAFAADLAGHRVMACNCTARAVVSEVAGRLAAGRAFGVSFFVRHDGTAAFSLRSREGAVDVAELAKAFGGGGHARAAGFQVPAARLWETLRAVG